jgi:hypothetical protein
MKKVFMNKVFIDESLTKLLIIFNYYYYYYSFLFIICRVSRKGVSKARPTNLSSSFTV